MSHDSIANRSSSLFLSFEQWRLHNADLEITLRTELHQTAPSTPCPCIDQEEDSSPDPFCDECDGRGQIEQDDDDLGRTILQVLKQRYAAQLERDYRLAVQTCPTLTLSAERDTEHAGLTAPLELSTKKLLLPFLEVSEWQNR